MLPLMPKRAPASLSVAVDRGAENRYIFSMKLKVKNLIERYVAVLSSWDGVECITLNEAAQPDVLDPYFALILDVFYEGELPVPAARALSYGDTINVFESTGKKDRFLADDIPVRIEFKEITQINELVGIASARLGALYLIKDSGTYTFYRLAEGKILFSRGAWMNELRSLLGKLDGSFWELMRAASQSKMEHFLSDLGAALLQEDDFFYLMSASGFIKTACFTLFCANRCFEPSHRQYYLKALTLPILPDSFNALLDTFLRGDVSMEHRYAAAQVIARGIIAL